MKITTEETPHCVPGLQATKDTLFVAVQKGRFSMIGEATEASCGFSWGTKLHLKAGFSV
jgi:hypothetical protein